METPVVVALIASLASVCAACIAGVMSYRATRGARAIASLNQKIARIDAEADQLREDFRNYIEILGGAAQVQDVGRLLGASELLQANPRASRLLRSSARTIADSVALRFTATTAGPARPVPGLEDERFDALRNGFEESARALSELRASLLD